MSDCCQPTEDLDIQVKECNIEMNVSTQENMEERIIIDTGNMTVETTELLDSNNNTQQILYNVEIEEPIERDIENEINESVNTSRITGKRPSLYKQVSSKIVEKTSDQEFMQRVNMSISVLLELYRVITSSLLILFVPQLCEDHVCTYSENLIWESNMVYNVAIVFNFISLFSLSGMYAIEVKRENRLIKYLDVNINMPNGNEDVANALSVLPEDKRDKIIEIDQYYQYSFYISTFIYILNIMLSAVIANEYYLSGQTTSTFITYVLFLFTKLGSVYTIANTPKNVFYSAYLKSNVQYNDVDRKLKPVKRISN